MSGALLQLAALSSQDVYLTANPEITLFKKTYMRYTNFSIETVSQYFKTPPDFNRKVTVNSSKNADLLTQIYLFISLYSYKLHYIIFLDYLDYIAKLGANPCLRPLPTTFCRRRISLY